MSKCKMCGASTTFAMVRYTIIDCKDSTRHEICKNCKNKLTANDACTIDPSTGRLTIVSATEGEVRKVCNVCGNVFCYSHMDIANNQLKAKQAKMSAFTGVATAIGGQLAASAVEQGNAQNALNQITDFNKCPKCGSLDLREISKDEYNNILKSQQSPNTVTGASAADELKKFKELLDMGVISQEEFDAKKKQLLGL